MPSTSIDDQKFLLENFFEQDFKDLLASIEQYGGN